MVRITQTTIWPISSVVPREEERKEEMVTRGSGMVLEEHAYNNKDKDQTDLF